MHSSVMENQNVVKHSKHTAKTEKYTAVVMSRIGKKNCRGVTWRNNGKNTQLMYLTFSLSAKQRNPKEQVKSKDSNMKTETN